MHKSRLAIAAAAAVGILATFLPWAQVSVFGISTSISGTHGDGWISLAFSLVCLTIALLGNRDVPVTSKKKYTVAIMGLLVLVIGLFEFSNVSRAASTIDADVSLQITSSPSIGIYVVILAGLALVALPFVIKGQSVEAKVSQPQQLVRTS